MRLSPFLAVTAAVLAAVSLSGCSGLGTYVSQAVAAREGMNDAQAALTLRAVCDLSVGATLRRPRKEQAAVGILCAPPDSKVGDFALEQLLDEATR